MPQKSFSPAFANSGNLMLGNIDPELVRLFYEVLPPAILAPLARRVVEEMRRTGLNDRKVYERKYTPEANCRQLLTIYEEAIAENQRNRY